jgi:hypothetical protein
VRERPLKPILSIEQRRALKPEPGDIIKYQEKLYVTVAVGSRFVRAYEQGTDRKDLTEMLPIQFVIKMGQRVAP